MAGPYPCDGCGGEEIAAFSVSNVETGETTFYGVGCFARFGLAMAKELLPPEEIAETLGPLLIEGGKGERPAETAKAARKSKAEGKAPAKPAEPPAEPVEGAAATAENG